jgi:LAS superfamily LD-carboxypeptidase LdcB
LLEQHELSSGAQRWTSSRWSGPLRRYAVAMVALIVVTLVPTATDAQPSRAAHPGDDPQSTKDQQAQVRAKQGEVALQVNVLKARASELNAALKKLATNVAAQRSRYARAQERSAQADRDLAVASVAVNEAQKRVDALEVSRQQLMVDSFTNPPSESAVDVFDVKNISEATIKQALLEMQADRQSKVLDQLTAAHEDVKLYRETKAKVAGMARRRRASTRNAFARVRAAQAQQQRFADEAEAALESKLSESAQLAKVDHQLSVKIAAEQAELARRLTAAQAAADKAAAAAAAKQPASGGSLVKAAPGGLVTVTCPNGDGTITVAASIGTQLRNMLNAAWSAGVGLCGWGYRDPAEQIALRRAHCGTSYYDIYQAPASSCSPPTARPGYSMHEQGLAIDFTCNGGGSIESHSSPCFIWLDAHAATYGFHNLASEPWHFSVNGH